MTEHDTLQRFLLETAQVRGEIVRLNSSYQAILDRHPYPPAVRELLGQALAAVTLLSAILKFEGRLTLQIQSDGPINFLLVQSDHQQNMRGLAQWQSETVGLSFEKLFGNGHLVLIVTPNEGKRYQGVVELVGDSLAACLESYFYQSEQLPTWLKLCANSEGVAGMLLQSLPSEVDTEQVYAWEHLMHLANTLTQQELLELSNREILRRLFNSEDARLFDSQSVCFSCSCNIERMERALRLMGRQEVDDILRESDKVIVTCEFCNGYYSFNIVDIARIFSDGNATSNDSLTRH